MSQAYLLGHLEQRLADAAMVARARSRHTEQALEDCMLDWRDQRGSHFHLRMLEPQRDARTVIVARVDEIARNVQQARAEAAACEGDLLHVRTGVDAALDSCRESQRLAVQATRVADDARHGARAVDATAGQLAAAASGLSHLPI